MKMADISMKSTWTMKLETTELRLVLKALGGRLLNDEILEASKLGDRLTKLRVEATKAAVEMADKTLAKVEEKERK